MIEIQIPVPARNVVESEYRIFADGLEKVVYEIQKRLKHYLDKEGLHPTVKYRVKCFESYYQKMLHRAASPPKYKDWYLMTDLLGIRVVCPFMADLPVVEDILSREFCVKEREKKGAEFSFKEFGYDSLHYLVEIPIDLQEQFRIPKGTICEVQLRTILQDAWAEVEHELVYKSDHTPFDESLRRKLAALNANLSLADMIFHEIREYQRELQRQIKKRRSDFRSLVKNDTETPVAGILLNDPEIELEIQPELRKLANLPRYDRIDEMLLKALYAHNSHHYREAIELYSRIEHLGPRPAIHGIVLVHRGMAWFALGEYGEAINDFTASLPVEGDHRKALHYRAVAWRQLGEHGKALDDLDTCLNIDAYQHDVLICRAQVYFKLGDYAAALHDVDAALALDPEDGEARRLRDVLNEKLGM
jgi:putative GTP pyrophosphokinase